MKTNSENQSHFFIPDLCKPTSLLYSILVSLLCTYAWELAGGDFQWRSLGMKSLVVQWTVLLSSAALCQLRPYLTKMSLKQGFMACFMTILVIGTSLLVFGQLMLQPLSFGWSTLLQQGLALAIIAAMVLRFFQLQQSVIEHSNAQVASQMNALQARIKPHFLFNSLNTIAELIVSRPADAEQAVVNLANLFRANLKETTGLCPLAQELTLVKGYLQLEQWRLGERLRLDWRESVHDDSWEVPVLCLQPLVENAVVHGVSGSSTGGLVTVSILQTPKVITLAVENTLMAEAGTHRGHGVGLNNVQQRLRVLYGERARCRVEQTERTFKVTITLPNTHERHK